MYTGVWIDHKHAFLIQFDSKAGAKTLWLDSNITRIPKSKGGNGRAKVGQRAALSEHSLLDRKKHQQTKYFKDVLSKAKGARKVLVFGPGLAKKEFVKVLMQDKTLSNIPLIVESSDKLTEPQMVAYAKKILGFEEK